MQRHDYRVELFSEESVQTEATAYRLLCDHPVSAEINYFAAPWSVLIRRRELEIPELRLDGGFTVCQHVWFDRIIPICLKIGLDTLFTPHVEPGFRGAAPRWMQWADRSGVFRPLVRAQLEIARRFRILPFPHLAVNTAPPRHKDLWYSFIGSNTHSTRNAVLNLSPQHDTAIVLRDKWHFEVEDAKQREAELQEYVDVLARSRYSLCPRGFGISTLRFWESLVAGAIPVLIADDMQLPPGFEWDECLVRVPEKRAAELEMFLHAISSEREQQLRANCLSAAEQFGGRNLVSCIHAEFSARRQAA